MKKFAKFFVSLILAISLTLHSFYLPAWANERIEYREDGIYHYVEDCNLIPSPAEIESGIGTTSLGLTLSAAQIAALIAGSVGVVYTASNWDALGSHLQTALNDAASNISGGTEALLNWWSAAVNGEIKLSALSLAGDIWIANTIMDVIYNIHQGLSYPQASPLGQYAPVEAGTLVPAGTPIYYGGININQSTGEISRIGQCVFDFDTFVFPFVMYSYGTIYTSYYVFKQEAGVEGSFTIDGVSNSFSSKQSGYLTSDSTGLTRHYVKLGGSFGSSHTTALQNAFNTYVSPGAFVMDKNPWNYSFSLVGPLFESYMQNLAIDGAVPMPDNVSVCPDVMVGGISQAWSDQGIGTDVITLPDIALDGSTLISGDSSTAIDQSISDALGKVATGELTWDDLWLDISGTKPEITVKDDAAEDVGGPITLPDWFVDFCDRVTGSADDRNDKIDSLLPGLGDGMALIDGFESDILDQFNNAFNDLDLDGFQLSSGILAALTWLVYWVVQFFNASGDLQVVILLPMLLGLALLFIGRGSMAMQRVEASHLKASLKKDGGGSS